MNKAYFIVPLILLLVFTGFYTVHRSSYQQHQADKAAAIAATLQAKTNADIEARKAAMSEAIAAAEQRKKERDAKAAREAAAKEARQVAIDARDKAYREQERSAKQIERTKKELEIEEAALAKLAADQKTATAEKAFLTNFVTKAQTNVQALQSLLAKLDNPPAAPAVQ